MKDKANSLLEEDIEEMRTWRVLNLEEIDQCWKKLAERMKEEVLRLTEKRNLARYFTTELGDVVRECKAMHEVNFLSSWLREVGEDKKEIEADKEEESKKGTRYEEKEENESIFIRLRPLTFLVMERIRSAVVVVGRICGAILVTCLTVTGVAVVIDVLVSPSSAVSGMCEGVSLDSGWELVEPRSFSFSKKRSI